MRKDTLRSLAAGCLTWALIGTGCAPDQPTSTVPTLAPQPPPLVARNAVSPSPPIAQTPGIASIGNPQIVAASDGLPWTGVAVSRSGRMFVCCPRDSEDAPFTLAEVRQGRAAAFPDAIANQFSLSSPRMGFCSAQSVVAGTSDMIWVLDGGTSGRTAVVDGAAKLVEVNLADGHVARVIPLGSNVAPAGSVLCDLRINPRLGQAGIAAITDSGDKGPGGIIVVDLNTGNAWRKLAGNALLRAEKDFTATVEGRPMRSDGGASALAFSSDGRTLFVRPLGGRRLIGISAAALADPSENEDHAAQSLVEYANLGYASAGMECDAAGRLYLSDYEHNAIHRLTFGPAGPADIADQIVASDPRMIWPDRLCIGNDGFLYFTLSQTNRQARFNAGQDLRSKPFLLMRVKIDAGT